MLTTLHSVLKRQNISLVGGTGDANKVSVNGKIYEDAVAYALIKNNNGRVKAYKENIYRQMGNYRFIASKTKKSEYILGQLNGKPAKQVYQHILNVSEEQILTQTFKNPFEKLMEMRLVLFRLRTYAITPLHVIGRSTIRMFLSCWS